MNAVRRGLLPAGVSAAQTLRREGLTDLHWKVLGDLVVGFLRHSGPPLTKLGQLLATRVDLLPEPLCKRLETLYDQQPPMSREALDRVLAEAYPGRRPFVRLQRKPLAVGSVGQVHRARSRDGRRLIVKVVRPDIEEEIRRDVSAACVLAGLFFDVVARDERSARAVVLHLLDDLGQELTAAANLENEADALEEFGRHFAGNPRVRVPVCYREVSTRGVLVLEELSGEPLSAVRERARSDPDTARRVADLALREILSQVLDEGRFHADPHGGNLLLLDDGRLGIIDLGSTGRLNDEERRALSRATRAFLARDADAAIEALLEFGTAPGDLDLEALKADVRQVVGSHPVLGGEELVRELLCVAERHRVRVAPSAALLVRALVTVEGVARSLDPDVDLIGAAVPVLLSSLAPRWLRWRTWRRAAKRGIRRSV